MSRVPAAGSEEIVSTQIACQKCQGRSTMLVKLTCSGYIMIEADWFGWLKLVFTATAASSKLRLHRYSSKFQTSFSPLQQQVPNFVFTATAASSKLRLHRCSSKFQTSSSPLQQQVPNFVFTATAASSKLRLHRHSSKFQTSSSPLQQQVPNFVFTATAASSKLRFSSDSFLPDFQC